MLQAWRIVKQKHASTAFDGEGARLYGGRWNSPGVAVVYVSSSKSLAALETLVHLVQPVKSKYVAIPIEFADSLVEVFPTKKLPKSWKLQPPPLAAQGIGHDWVKSARSAILALPSVITGETNYLLNPHHPAFKKIKIGQPTPFTFDPRLLT